jgi:hypothetical protein
VVERFLALARRLDEDAKIGARLLLPDEFGLRAVLAGSYGDSVHSTMMVLVALG